MNRSDLIRILTARSPQLSVEDVKAAVTLLLEAISKSLANGQRVEIRHFGSLSCKWVPTRTGRNPKTGELVTISAKSRIHFKPGKTLRDRVLQH